MADPLSTDCFTVGLFILIIIFTFILIFIFYCCLFNLSPWNQNLASTYGTRATSNNPSGSKHHGRRIQSDHTTPPSSQIYENCSFAQYETTYPNFDVVYGNCQRGCVCKVLENVEISLKSFKPSEGSQNILDKMTQTPNSFKESSEMQKPDCILKDYDYGVPRTALSLSLTDSKHIYSQLEHPKNVVFVNRMELEQKQMTVYSNYSTLGTDNVPLGFEADASEDAFSVSPLSGSPVLEESKIGFRATRGTKSNQEYQPPSYLYCAPSDISPSGESDSASAFFTGCGINTESENSESCAVEESKDLLMGVKYANLIKSYADVPSSFSQNLNYFAQKTQASLTESRSELRGGFCGGKLRDYVIQDEVVPSASIALK